ncbi:MAG TPA: hypothetical protein DCE41_33540 [Cytophagales bacterium]|nr:hypothetical protein [Cytophagales bacterium]
MRILRAFLIVTSLFVSCQPVENQITFSNDEAQRGREWLPEPDLDLRLSYEKRQIDANLTSYALSVWVVTADQDVPQEVLQENWPPQVLTTYNIYKSPSDQIVMIAEYPFSESGNWFSHNKMYFDEAGAMYAQNIQTVTHNSQCAEVSVVADTTRLFAQGQLRSMIAATYEVLGDTLKTPCEDLYAFDYAQPSTVREYLQATRFIR